MTDFADQKSDGPNRTSIANALFDIILLWGGFVAARLLLGIVRTRTLTEVLPKESYGFLTLVVMTTLYACLFLSLGVHEYLVRRLPGMKAEEQGSLFKSLLSSLALPIWLATGVAMSCVSLLGTWDFLSRVDMGLLWVGFGISFWLHYRTYYYLGSGRLSLLRMIQLGQQELWFLPVLGVAIFISTSFTCLLVAWVVWLGFYSIMVLLLGGRIQGRSGNSEGVFPAIRFGVPLLPLLAGDIIFRLFDRYLLLGHHGVSVTANYLLCGNIAWIGYSVGASLLDIKLPGLIAERNKLPLHALPQSSEKVREAYSIMFKWAMSICIPFVLALIVLNQPIIRLLSSPAFHDAAPLLVWLAPTPALFLMLSLLSRGFLIQNQSMLVGLSTLVAAVVGMMLSFVLIPRWGAPGAAVATMSGLTLLCIWFACRLQLWRWLVASVLRVQRLCLLALSCAGGFVLIRVYLPDQHSSLVLFVAMLWTGLMLCASGLIVPSEFARTSGRHTIERKNNEQ